jgi:hypothetical protein
VVGHGSAFQDASTAVILSSNKKQNAKTKEGVKNIASRSLLMTWTLQSSGILATQQTTRTSIGR